eukprot:COSAG01_NODE_1721_length_9391_cov_5.427249_14_plen_85_part_00
MARCSGGGAALSLGQEDQRRRSAAAELRRWQVRSSLTYYAVIWFLGLQSGIIGPSLGELAALVGKPDATALAPQVRARVCGWGV